MGDQRPADPAPAQGGCHAQVIHPGAVGVMADMDAARQPLVLEGEKQLGIGRRANEGQLALGIVVGPQEVAGGPKLDDGGEILVAVAAQREGHDSADVGSEGFGSTGVSPGRPHSAQEPS